MTVRVGVIGVGVMGADHARIFAREVRGAEIAAIYDADAKRAAAVASETGARDLAASPESLIADRNVDAVVIASPDSTHAPFALAALAARKPVLCEKPLAASSREALEVVAAESRLGKRLAQVGFMRRYDPPYVAMKAKWKTGALGRPLMFHCVHRNASAPAFFTADMAIANSAPHEFDVARYMLDCDLTEIAAFQPASASAGQLVKPVFLILRSAEGALVDVEVNVNAAYGYDVRGELVCERGTVALGAPAAIEVNLSHTRSTAYPEDWRPRFAEAYRLQDQAWLNAIERDSPDERAASAWDGYAAAIVAEAGLRALHEGRAVAVAMAEKPGLYQKR